MCRYSIGQCIILFDQENEDLLFCEVLGYLGSGLYQINLTRGLVETSPNRIPSMSTIHESVLEELQVDESQLGLT